MTTIELKTALHHTIDKLDEAQLRQLHATVSSILTKESEPAKQRKVGTMKGLVTYIADDFDAPLDDFKEYM